MKTPKNEMHEGETEEKDINRSLIDECEHFSKLLNQNHDIKALVISITPSGAADPIVYFNGEQLDYTELACMTASRMRANVLQRIGMQG